MYECPNCTLQQAHEIYTCMNCGHVVKEYKKFGGWQPQCEEPDIDGAQMAHDEMENDHG
ncbi:MAG: hypothetical protein GQ553_04445 [Nitrosomonadaceae bacterium]|nr:hypothetical protein [Nitrosomonadaceae bacterium]